MRKWKQYPSDLKVPTPLGEVVISVTEAAHIYVDFPSLVVNGGEVRGSIHLYKWADGAWHIGGEKQGEWDRRQSLYARKSSKGSFIFINIDEASEKQRAKIADVVVPAVVAFINEHRDLLVDAQKAYINNKLLDLEKKADEQKNALQVLEDQITLLRREEKSLTPRP